VGDRPAALGAGGRRRGTTLRFTTWLGPVGKGAANTAAGYHVCLDHLAELLDTGSAPPLVDSDPSELERSYGALV
jgi:hypothetical protein